MTFPNAFHGVKKLFTSEILNLIGGLCALLAAVFAVIATNSANAGSGAGTAAGGIGAVIFLAAAGVLPIIGYIMKLVGLNQAGKDEARFKQAFIVSLIALILTAVSAILAATNAGGGVVDNIIKIFVEIANIAIVILVISGVQNLAVRCSNEGMLSFGSKIKIMIIIIYVLALIANLVIVIFGTSTGAAVTAGTFGIIAAILDIVAYIIFLVYLGKAKKMLAEK